MILVSWLDLNEDSSNALMMMMMTMEYDESDCITITNHTKLFWLHVVIAYEKACRTFLLHAEETFMSFSYLS